MSRDDETTPDRENEFIVNLDPEREQRAEFRERLRRLAQENAELLAEMEEFLNEDRSTR